MINSIILSDFRNHAFTKIDSRGASNVIITGKNGGGKTAVLEAISMLCGGGGLRGADMQDIARIDGSGNFSVFARMSDESELSVEFSNGDQKRRAKIDGDASAISDMSRHLRLCWVTPKEDRVFVDSSSDRRAFFDRLCASFDPAHSGRTARLGKLLTERAAVLKNNADARWLSAIDAQLAATAVAVAAARIAYAGAANHFANDCGITIRGMLESLLAEGYAAADVEKKYVEYLFSNRFLSADKMTIDGPHRSDFGANSFGMPAEMLSTGQQKSVLAEIMAAHALMLKSENGEGPVILLDEAAAHLDESAREKMFNAFALADAQVWCTGVDPRLFSVGSDSLFLTCKDGMIVTNI
jgi:DNA replication and repair protein RecF